MADRTVLVRLRANVSDFNRGIISARTTLRGFHDEIDKTNDRTAWLAQGILALAPAVTTLGAGAVPVISGLATQMTLTAGAAGTMVLAFNGVGDALGALNDYQLDPTEAHLKKLNEEMGKIGPEGQEFVEFLDSLGPQFSDLANISRQGVFPGVTEGLESFMSLMPQVSVVVSEIAQAMGELGGDAGSGLAGPGWEEFFTYLEQEAKPLLIEMGHTIGNFITGLATMIAQFAPLTRDFSSGLEGMSKSFADWADQLDESRGFQEFLAYVQEAGPMALDFFGSLVMAFVELVEAAAPVGAIMLPQLTNLLDIIGSLANTPLGPLALGFVALTSAWGRLNAVVAITGSGAMGKVVGNIRASGAAAVVSARQVSNAGASWKAFGNSLYNSSIPTATLVRDTKSLDAATRKHATSALRSRSAMESWTRNARRAARAAAPMAASVGLAAVAMTDLDDKAGLANTTMLALTGSLAGPWGIAAGAAVGATMDLAAAQNMAVDAQERWLAIQAETPGNMEEYEASVAAAEAAVDSWQNQLITALGPETRAEKALRELVAQYPEVEKAAKELAQTQNRAALDDRHVEAYKAYTSSLKDARTEARKTADEFLGLGDSLDDAKVSLSEWLAELEQNSVDLANFRKNAVEASDRGLRKGLIEDLKDAGVQGARRMRQLANGTEAEIRRANQAWVSNRREMKKWVDFEVPVKNLHVNVDPAMFAINRLERRLNNLRGDIKLDVMANTGVPGFDSGGTIPGPRYPYRDSVIIAAAPTEEMVSNDKGQADRYRPVLKAINNDAPPTVVKQMLAGGGTVGWSSAPTVVTAAGGSIDYERLAAAMLMARPLYGDVNVQPHDYSEFRRQQQQDAQAAGLGGRPS